MNRTIGRFGLFAGFLLLLLNHAAVGRDWPDDLDEAKRLAAKDGKDILIVFSGTAWCGACISLKREVFDKPEFDAVRESFVVVVMESPASEEAMPAKQREMYRDWQTKYGIRAVPTVLLADATGKPYAFTGNRAAPREYLRQLHELQDVRRRRDAAFAKAAAASGIEKAKYLDEALSAMNKAFGSQYTDIQGDPLVRFYRPEIDEILALDAKNEAGLRDKYAKTLDAEAERKRIEDIYAKIKAVAQKDGNDAAIRLIDQELHLEKSVALKKRLRLSRRVYLEWSQRFADALAYTKQLLADPTMSLSADERLDLHRRVGYNLWKLNRIDEAAALYDELISQAATDSRRGWGLHLEKADMLMYANRLRESLTTWEQARKYVKAGTEDWLLTESRRAILMMKMGRFAEAEAVHDEMLKSGAVDANLHAILLYREAWQLKLAGRRQDALEKARSADKLLNEVKPDRTERAQFDEFRKNVRTLIRDTSAADDQSSQSP